MGIGRQTLTLPHGGTLEAPRGRLCRRFVRRAAAWMLLAMIAAALATPLAAAEPKSPATAEKIARWIAELDADGFVDRETATQKLISAGNPVIKPISQAIIRSGLEGATRGVYVLQQLALADDFDLADAARDALQKLSLRPQTAVARRAGQSLAKLAVIRQERALEELARLGAKLDFDTFQLGAQFSRNTLALQIDDSWRGELRDLRRLQALRDLQQLTFIGRRVTDQWVSHMEGLPNLKVLVLKRTSVSDAALAYAASAPNLQSLYVFYSPIGDGAINHLQRLKRVLDVRLIGTKVSPAAAEKLAQALPGAKIDRRDGGFLGVGGAFHPQGCLIERVQADTAAAKAGLAQGDIITTYNGKKVANFEELTIAISDNSSGDRITLQILRGAETIKVEATLGEFE